MAERGTLTFRGAPLVVREAGDGPTVGYLHGMIGTPDGHPFLAALAARGRHVVAPSLPGFTGSAPCGDIRGLYDWVVALSEVIDLCGLAGRPVVASSVGAMLALELSAVRPEVFTSLVLVAPFGLFALDDPTTDPFATTLSNQRALLTADPLVTAPFFDDGPGRSAEQLVDDNVARYFTRTAAASLVWPLPEFGLSTRLHLVRVPVTLVWGGDDHLVPPSYLERFAAALPNVVARHVVAGAGHLAEWDRPDAVAAIAMA